MTKALAGDQAALMQVISQSSAAAVAQSAATTAKMLEDTLAKQERVFNETVMPAKLREHAVQSAAAENPLFNDPASKPLMVSLTRQLEAAYPTASPAEIATHAKEYLTGFAGAVLKSNGQTIAEPVTPRQSMMQAKGVVTDWDAWFRADGVS